MKYSHRICYYFSKNEVLFVRILEYIRHNKDAIDEIVLFFDDTCSAYQADEKLYEQSTICKKRIQQLKEAGIKSVGINVLATLGHKWEAWSWNPVPPFQTAVGAKGKNGLGQLCPRNDEAKEYIRRKYRAAIKAEPDFIWVDDDLRVIYHEDGNCPCFCDGCVEKFSRIIGKTFSRETLVEELNNPENKELREKWLNYNLDSYKDVVSVIREEVEKSHKKIELGLMTVHLEQNTKLLSGSDKIAEALGATMLRPGGGFFQDFKISDLFGKICGIVFQNAKMSKIPLKMYELEDFPDTVPNKSVRTHILESTMAIMAGCDGIMTNSMPPNEGTSVIYKAFEKQRECHSIIADRMRETVLTGARPAFCPDIDIHIKSADWFGCCKNSKEEAEKIVWNENVFIRSGFVPYTDYLNDDSWLTFISGEMARAIPDEELKKMLSRGVFIDGTGASVLCEKGYEKLIGCTIGETYDNGLEENYTDHFLNGKSAFERRNTRMTYEYSCRATCLNPLEGAEILNTISSISGVKVGISAIAFENELGGRCVVMGYDPWRYPNMWHRELQLKNIFSWLWNGHEPYSGIESPGIFQLYRESVDKSKFIMMLTNGWEDETGEQTICFANEFKGEFVLYNGNGIFEDIKDVTIKNGKTIVKIPSIDNHKFAVIMNKEVKI